MPERPRFVGVLPSRDYPVPLLGYCPVRLLAPGGPLMALVEAFHAVLRVAEAAPTLATFAAELLTGVLPTS